MENFNTNLRTSNNFKKIKNFRENASLVKHFRVSAVDLEDLIFVFLIWILKILLTTLVFCINTLNQVKYLPAYHSLILLSIQDPFVLQEEQEQALLQIPD